MMIFVNAVIKNPSWSDQQKTRLVTDSKNFQTSLEIPEKILKQIYNSEITDLITDWMDKKKIADENAAERAANKNIAKVKVQKLTDCGWAGKAKYKDQTSLAITEGDSAAAGFRQWRNPNTQALFAIRGKILNVRETPKDKILGNEEIKGIMASMGLQFGKSPFVYDSAGNLIEDNLRIHEVRIYSDADVDGDAICGLLVNIFEVFWPELFKERRIARVETPILMAKNKKETIRFYTDDEFHEWCKKNDSTKWNICYYKGLGALSPEEYKRIIQEPRIYYFELDDMANEKLDIWFGKDSDKRKKELAK